MAEIKRIMVRVPADLHKAVRIKAVKEGRTVSEVIREFLEEWVKGEPTEEEEKSPE